MTEQFFLSSMTGQFKLAALLSEARPKNSRLSEHEFEGKRFSAVVSKKMISMTRAVVSVEVASR